MFENEDFTKKLKDTVMNQTIGEIKNFLQNVPIANINCELEKFKDDERKSVQKIVERYEKKYCKFSDEMKRLESISCYEKKYYEKGVKFIAGIDEVGRGPLAGPVTAAAVILPKDCRIIGIDDSKRLSEKKRKELFREIEKNALAIGIGTVSNIVIDEINILQATYKAMRIAVSKLKIMPQQLLVDAVTIPQTDISQEGIVKGDSKSISIAAASIIAKVTRDELMKKYGEVYEGYFFEKNKGYGSKEHIDAIKRKGLSPIHRKSFTKNFV